MSSATCIEKAIRRIKITSYDIYIKLHIKKFIHKIIISYSPVYEKWA